PSLRHADAGKKATFEPCEPGLDLSAELSRPLLELRVEPGEIELVEISELLLVRGIHRVEPVHELINDRVSEPVVEFSRQLRRDRHAESPGQSRRYHNLRSAPDGNQIRAARALSARSTQSAPPFGGSPTHLLEPRRHPARQQNSDHDAGNRRAEVQQ